MKGKKNIILLIFAVILFIIALAFFMWSFFGEHNTNIKFDGILEKEKSSNNDIAQNKVEKKNGTTNEEQEENGNEDEENVVNNEDGAEVSNTQDVENVSYTDITVFKEDNTETTLSEFSGKPVMLLFWNSENEDSINVLKKVNEIYKNYDGKIEFLMVSTSKEIPENLKNEISVNVYYDLNNEYQTKYNVEIVPTMVYIDKENKIMNAKSGVPSSDAIEANLDILADNF